MISSLDTVYMIYKKDRIIHPVFGTLLVEGLYKTSDSYDAACTLLDFGNILKIFDAKDLSNLKFKSKPKLRRVK